MSTKTSDKALLVLPLLLVSMMAMCSSARAADVREAQASLRNVTGLPGFSAGGGGGDGAKVASCARQSAAAVEVGLEFVQRSADAALEVRATVSGLMASGTADCAGGAFSLGIHEYARYYAPASTPVPTDADSARYQFGANVAVVWDAVADTPKAGPPWTTSLKGVSLRAGEASSCLGRSVVLTYCKGGTCAIVQAGTIGKAETADGDTNVAGPGPATVLGNAALVCSLNTNHGTDSFFSGAMLVSKDLESTVVRMRATGSALQLGSTHRVSLHAFGEVSGGGSGATIAGTLGAVFDGEHVHHDSSSTDTTNYHHNLPCSSQRRIGDLGNAVVQQLSSTSTTSLKYDGRFVSFNKLAPLVGSACAVWSKPDVTCAEWASGCSDYRQNDVLLGVGIVGLANPGAVLPGSSGNSNSNTFDYDCTPNSASKRAVARIWPVVSRPAGSPSVSGVAYFHSNGGTAGGVTVDLNVVGLRDATKSGAAVTVQTVGMGIGAKGVFSPLGRTPGLPPTTTRRAGDLGNVKMERDYGYFSSLQEQGVSLDDPARSILGRAVAIYADPAPSHGVGRDNTIVAWGIVGRASDNTLPPRSTMPAVPGIAAQGSDEVACVLRNDLGDSVGVVRMTSVMTYLGNSTSSSSARFNTPAILVRGDLEAVAFSGHDVSKENAQVRIELYTRGDRENLGARRAGSSLPTTGSCPSSASRFGLLGVIPAKASAAGGSGVKWVALLPSGTDSEYSSGSVKAESLNRLAGTSCVLTAVVGGDGGDTTTNTQLASGVVGLSAPLSAKEREGLSYNRFPRLGALSEYASFSNQADCMHVDPGTFRPKRGNETSSDTKQDADQGMNTAWMWVLIVCLSVGGGAALVMLVGALYMRHNKRHAVQLEEEARMIRSDVESIDIDPDKGDLAAPPPPKEVLLKAADLRESLRRSGVNASVDLSRVTLNFGTNNTGGGGGGGYAAGNGRSGVRPQHRRVASRFKTKPNARLEMTSLPHPHARVQSYGGMRAARGGGGGHNRSKTIAKFRANKRYAQQNAEALAEANAVGREETIVMSTKGRPLSVKIGRHRSTRSVQMDKKMAPPEHPIQPEIGFEALPPLEGGGGSSKKSSRGEVGATISFAA